MSKYSLFLVWAVLSGFSPNTWAASAGAGDAIPEEVQSIVRSAGIFFPEEYFSSDKLQSRAAFQAALNQKIRQLETWREQARASGQPFNLIIGRNGSDHDEIMAREDATFPEEGVWIFNDQKATPSEHRQFIMDLSSDFAQQHIPDTIKFDQIFVDVSTIKMIDNQNLKKILRKFLKPGGDFITETMGEFTYRNTSEKFNEALRELFGEGRLDLIVYAVDRSEGLFVHNVKENNSIRLPDYAHALAVVGEEGDVLLNSKKIEKFIEDRYTIDPDRYAQSQATGRAERPLEKWAKLRTQAGNLNVRNKERQTYALWENIKWVITRHLLAPYFDRSEQRPAPFYNPRYRKDNENYAWFFGFHPERIEDIAVSAGGGSGGGAAGE